MVGRNLTFQGKYNESIDIFRYLLEEFPDSHYSYFMIGRNYAQLGKYNKAVEEYEIAIRLRDDLRLPGFKFYLDYLKNARKMIKN